MFSYEFQFFMTSCENQEYTVCAVFGVSLFLLFDFALYIWKVRLSFSLSSTHDTLLTYLFTNSTTLVDS